MTKRKSAKAKEIRATTPTEAVRNGWLAYLGLYGVALERVKPTIAAIGEKYTDVFGDLVAKGETVEATAIERMQDARDRVEGLYEAAIEKARVVVPFARPAAAKVKTLEAEIDALNAKIAELSKKPATKVVRARAKKAA
jgi:polyhydroxyalkanoate synthesis regulator phasin